MNKKVYQKPSMKAVALRQKAQLLTGSGGVTASRINYGDAITQEWGSEEEPNSEP